MGFRVWGLDLRIIASVWGSILGCPYLGKLLQRVGLHGCCVARGCMRCLKMSTHYTVQECIEITRGNGGSASKIAWDKFEKLAYDCERVLYKVVYVGNLTT